MVRSDYSFSSHIDPNTPLDVSAVSTHGEVIYGLWDANRLVEAGSILSDDPMPFSSRNIKDENVLYDELPCLHTDYNTFDPNLFNQYFKFTTLPSWVEKSGIEKYEKFKERKIFSLYYINKKDNKAITKLFSDPDYFHISSGLANLIRNEEIRMLCLLRGNHIHICIQKEGKFQFYNRYICTDKKDFLYFVLLTREQFDIPFAEIRFGGELDSNSPVYELLNAHCESVQFYKATKYEVASESYPAHYFLPLMAAKECG